MLFTLKSSHSGKQINENPVISSANVGTLKSPEKKIKPQMADSKNKDSDLIAVG